MIWLFFGLGHSIPNGDRTFAQLTEVAMATPALATDVHEQLSGARWIAGCPHITEARDGWITDDVQVDFTDLNSPRRVVREVDTALRARGWRRNDVSSSAGQGGMIASWTLGVHSSHRARAFAYAVPAGSTHWSITASWMPPGPRGQGCP